jgi:hypothetical protein
MVTQEGKPMDENPTENVWLIGPNGQWDKLIGTHGTTPECPEALFRKNSVVKVRRLKHLRDLPEHGAVVAVVPPGFSPDWAWDDLRGLPRRLMHQAPSRIVQYIIAFEGDPSPHLLAEKWLVATSLPAAEINFADEISS